MNKLAKIATTLSIAAACMTVFAQTANAQVSQSNNTTITCTTGSYGQNTCYSVNNQNTVLGATSTTGRSFVYQPANTGMDPQTTAIAIVSFVTTTGGAIISIKKKIW